MEQSDLITVVVRELKGLSSKFELSNYTDAVEDALRETGWSFPTTDSFKILWLKRRAKRHLFYMLWSEAANKFKFEQINLQHRFEHFGKLVEREDREFAKAVEERPDKFAGVDPAQMFGHKIDAGFASNDVGQDLTYDQDNVVIVTPSVTD